MPPDHALRTVALIFLSYPKAELPEFTFLRNVGVTEAIHIFYFTTVTRGQAGVHLLRGRVRKAPLEDARRENSAAHLALPRPPGLRHGCHERARKRAVSGTEGGAPVSLLPYWSRSLLLLVRGGVSADLKDTVFPLLSCAVSPK